MAMSSVPSVQRLYDVCKKVFTSTSVPSEAQVSNVRAILGTNSYHLMRLDSSFCGDDFSVVMAFSGDSCCTCEIHVEIGAIFMQLGYGFGRRVVID